tara:strand:- start:1666 stop:2226 length:561 start_codon:yes stop_codon:yes gene_type:complete
MKINANEIRVGMLIEYKNDLWEVLKIQHVKPGKGGAFNQVEMKSINNGTKINERFRSSETVEKATVEEEKFSFIYKDKDEFIFMNSKSYEQVSVGKNVIGEKEKMLSENLEVVVSFYDEKPIQIELPNQIVSKVKETEIAIKGQTVSSSYKPAILDNELKIQVPPFINIGDKIIIDTRTLEYLKKV